VRAIQQKLDGKGYGLAVDGQFGPKTEGVVKHFQAKAGISVDGLYGSRTKAALFGRAGLHRCGSASCRDRGQSARRGRSLVCTPVDREAG
jgi:hypothetical protein